MPRIGTLAGVPVDRFGRSTTTKSSAAATGRPPSCAMPGACLTMSVSGPVRPLVISDCDPLRRTIARSGDPVPCTAALKPSPIDSTDTSTTTTPAMPMTATIEELSRCGIVRMLTSVTAMS